MLPLVWPTGDADGVYEESIALAASELCTRAAHAGRGGHRFTAPLVHAPIVEAAPPAPPPRQRIYDEVTPRPVPRSSRSLPSASLWARAQRTPPPAPPPMPLPSNPWQTGFVPLCAACWQALGVWHNVLFPIVQPEWCWGCSKSITAGYYIPLARVQGTRSV